MPCRALMCRAVPSPVLPCRTLPIRRQVVRTVYNIPTFCPSPTLPSAARPRHPTASKSTQHMVHRTPTNYTSTTSCRVPSPRRVCVCVCVCPSCPRASTATNKGQLSRPQRVSRSPRYRVEWRYTIPWINTASAAD